YATCCWLTRSLQAMNGLPTVIKSLTRQKAQLWQQLQSTKGLRMFNVKSTFDIEHLTFDLPTTHHSPFTTRPLTTCTIPLVLYSGKAELGFLELTHAGFTRTFQNNHAAGITCRVGWCGAADGDLSGRAAPRAARLAVVRRGAGTAG